MYQVQILTEDGDVLVESKLMVDMKAFRLKEIIESDMVFNTPIEVKVVNTYTGEELC